MAVELPGPDKVYISRASLALIADMESTGDSLYDLAASLVDGAMTVIGTVAALKKIYRHAGCVLEEETLDLFLLTQPCADLLSDVLVDILNPMEPRPSVPTREFLQSMTKNDGGDL